MKAEEYQSIKATIEAGGAASKEAIELLQSQMVPGLLGIFRVVSNFYGFNEGISVTLHEAFHACVNLITGADTNIVGALIIEESFGVKPQPLGICEFEKDDSRINNLLYAAAMRIHSFIDTHLGGRRTVR